MAAAGLTHGGFYKHLESKDQLVLELFEGSLEQTLATMREKPLKAIATRYLAKDHRDTFVVTCPYASMGSELRHADKTTREAYSKGVSRFIDVIAESITDVPARERRAKAQAVVSSLVGALLLSRLVDDPKLSDDILKNTRKFISE
jgi:TetR/AcrR family transcriptional repressor of nem operon